MFKIGQFSKLTHVSIRMLRYYDETGLLKPAVTDKFTSYRLYTADQIPRLNKIIFLRDLDFNVAEIAAALNQWTDESVRELLNKKRESIEKEIKAARDKLSKIEQINKDIQQRTVEVNYNVAIKSIPSYQVFSLRRVVPDYYAEAQLWAEMADFAEKRNISLSGETLTIYHDLDFREKDVDIEICVQVNQMGQNIDAFTYRQTEAVSLMGCTMVYGSFENISAAFNAFAGWLEQHNQYRMAGESRQIVHRGPWNEENPEDYLIEIQIPLERKV